MGWENVPNGPWCVLSTLPSPEISGSKNQDYASAPNDFEYYSQSDTLSQQKESKYGHLMSLQAMQERLRKSTSCSCANLSLKQQTRRENTKNRTRPNTINYVM